MEDRGNGRSRKKRVLIIVPAICAVLIAVLPLIIQKGPFATHSDAVLGFGCGVLLGISLVCLVKLAQLRRRTRASLKMQP